MRHAAFGALMTAAAASSQRPWHTIAKYDRTEDLLHSVAATGMGFATAHGPHSRWHLVTRKITDRPNEGGATASATDDATRTTRITTGPSGSEPCVHGFRKMVNLV